MRDPLNDLRMRMKEALDNLWSRITGKFDTVHGRVDDAEAHIDDVEGELNTTKGRVTSVEGRMTTAEGQITGLNTRVGDLEDAVDDLDGAMIKTISLNGVNVPKDANGNVALQETDPTVPAWAKQAKAKTSDFTNDGDGSDNNSPFATQEYVRVNGGKIDEVQVNGTALPIVNKAVNVSVPTLLSQLTNDVGFTKDSIVEVDYGGQYISEIYPYLIDKIGNEEIRRFRANILRIGLLTNAEINVDVWGFIYRWDEGNADDDIWFTMVCYEEYSGNACYYARVYSNERDYQREIMHVDTVFQFGGGGGGSGAVDTITFNGVTYQPDSNGNVSFGFTETDPTVPSWAKAAQKPTYTASEVGAKPTQTAVADPTASGTAVAFIDSIIQNANGVITPTKKTVRSASQSESGLMSATDKAKLDGVAAGAQVNSITGVKGNAESSYRTGNVNLTPADIAFIGLNPTGGTSNDTREWWANKGTCYAFIAGANQVNGQPAEYGFIVNIVYANEVYQMWLSAPGGARYHRGGNHSTSVMPGWTADDTNIITSVNGQTGAVSITPANIGAAPIPTGNNLPVTGANDLNDSPPGWSVSHEVTDATARANAHMPFQAWCYIYTVESSAAGSVWKVQMAFPWYNTDEFAIRRRAGNGTWTKWTYSGINSTTVPGTPDSNGDISLGLSANSYIVVAAKIPGLIATPWVSGKDGNWHARITGVAGSAVTSGSVTVTVYYQAV